VKSGEIDPRALTPEAALALMLADPILIHRRLLQVGDRREAGFDADLVDAWIGLRPTATPVTDACPKDAVAGEVARP